MTLSASPTCALEPLPDAAQYLGLEMDRADFLLKGQTYLADLAAWVRDNNNAGAGSRVHAEFSRGHDALCELAYRYAAEQWRREHGEPTPAVAMVAIGGYGNRGLCLRSDIDLLVLMDLHAEPVEAFVKSLMLLMIDFRLNLGYVTRAIADCEAKIGADIESVTALASARFLAGDAPLFERFETRFKAALQGRGRRWFLKNIHEHRAARRLKYESTVYLLQPNLKEGEGGLRDVDAVRWALYAIAGSVDLEGLRKHAGFDDDSLRELTEALGAIQTLRNEVHIVSGAVGDVLLFDYMPEIARRLGYEEDQVRSAEEFLMADYYGRARTIDRSCSRAIQMLLADSKGIFRGLAGAMNRRRIDQDLFVQDQTLYIDPKSKRYFESDPRRILEVFHRCARWSFRLSDHTIDQLTRLSEELPADFVLDPANHAEFMGIMKSYPNTAMTLADMHECRILGRIVPEFENIRRMVRIDYYHHYTVDEHTFKAIENAERLRKEPLAHRTNAGEISRRIVRWELLTLALLLHDVGKGFGRGHALRGGQIAQRVCERMNLPDADAETVRFLILSHLKLNHAAQRRDITDPEVPRQLAEEIGTIERLDMLYVLTVCDLMAVSPDAWNDWKSQLLADCHMRTAELLGEKIDQPRPGAPNRADARARALNALLALGGAAPKDRPPLEAELDRFLREVSDYYMRTMSADTIARHCLLRREINDDNLLAWHLHNDPPAPAARRDPISGASAVRRFSHLIVLAADVPGLFSAVCGALAARGINIWSAQIFSTRDGYAINQFQVTDLDNKPLPEGMQLDRLRKDLNKVIKEEMTIEDLIARHKSRTPPRLRPRSVYPARVIVDNTSSQRYSILEIRAADRPGLLYRITRVLNECRIDIHRSIITTEAYGVVDIFYVTDTDYNKIHAEADQEKIRQGILDALAEED